MDWRQYYPRPLIFVHLPKAAGTTLESVILRQYRGYHAERLTGSPDEFERFKALPKAQLDRFDLIVGHQHFGVHELLTKPATYLTMLRDPVDRAISYFHHARTRPEHYLHKVIHERGWTLRDLLERGTTTELDNDQVRWLSRVPHDDVPFGRVSRAQLDEAKRNLDEHFAVVGVAERFHESLVMMQVQFGWLNVAYRRQNQTSERPSLHDVPADLIELIRAKQSLDIELYEHANHWLDAAIERVGPAFAMLLERFEATLEAAAAAADRSDALWQAALGAYREADECIRRGHELRARATAALASRLAAPTASAH